MPNYLALDLASKTGWARRVDGVLESGTWTLATDKEKQRDRELGYDRTGDTRFHHLLGLLARLKSEHSFDWVAFEDVQFSTYTLQTQLWSALRAAVWAVFPPCKIVAVPVGTLKEFATGHGGATKAMMGAWLVKKHPKLYRKPRKPTEHTVAETLNGRPIGDDEADALHLLEYLETIR